MEKNKLCRIRDIYRAIAMLESQFDKLYGLNLNEAMMLCTLKEKGSITASELAEILGLTHSNTSKIICIAEKKKLLSRKIDKNDKRTMHFSITSKGIDLLSKINCTEMKMPEILQDITCNNHSD